VLGLGDSGGSMAGNINSGNNDSEGDANDAAVDERIDFYSRWVKAVAMDSGIFGV
jgi:hypothetical protein